MVREVYGVHLTVEEKGRPKKMIRSGRSSDPEGHDHRTLRLLADKMVELGLVESLSYETVRLHLKKTRSSRGSSSSGASPR